MGDGVAGLETLDFDRLETLDFDRLNHRSAQPAGPAYA